MKRAAMCMVVLISVCIAASCGFAETGPAKGSAAQGLRSAGQSARGAMTSSVAGEAREPNMKNVSGSISFVVPDQGPYGGSCAVGTAGQIVISIINNSPIPVDYVSYRVSANGRQVQRSGVMNVGSGQQREARIPYTADRVGICEFLLEIDPDNSIAETNERDNTCRYQCNVTQEDQRGGTAIDALRPSAGS